MKKVRKKIKKMFIKNFNLKSITQKNLFFYFFI